MPGRADFFGRHFNCFDGMGVARIYALARATAAAAATVNTQTHARTQRRAVCAVGDVETDRAWRACGRWRGVEALMVATVCVCVFWVCTWCSADFHTGSLVVI